MISTIFTTFSVLGAAYASSVQPVVAKGGCYNINSYYPYTGTTGYFMAVVDGCVNTTATDKACSMEGFRDTTISLSSDDKSGYIGIGYVGNQAIVPLMCNRASPSVIDACVSVNNGCEFQSTNVSSSTGLFSWGLSAEESITVDFYHHVVDGEQQDGLFVGAENVTSWAIKHYPADSHSRVPYWLLRWLGRSEEMKEGEFKTFLKVDYF